MLKVFNIFNFNFNLYKNNYIFFNIHITYVVSFYF